MSTSIEALASLARELQGSHAFSELLQLVADRCAGLLETSRASIRLLDPGGSKLLAVCRAGSPLHLNPHEELRVGEGLMGWIVEHRQPLHTGDAEADARFVPRAGMRESLGSFVGVPLVAGDATLGVLSATSPERDRFTAAHVELLTLLAGIAAPHIEIARRDFVVRDPLTGLFNHAHFHKTLDGEIERSAVYGLPFSLVLIDIDRFRAVNESYGHGVGDALIKAIAEILVGRRQAPDGGFRLRGQDSAARYGGDELALLLPHTPKSGAAAKGDGLRAYVADYDFACLDLPAQTVSVGVAAIPDDAHDRSSLIAAAEQALFAAKRRGRNTTVAYSRAVATASAAQSSLSVDIDKFIALDATIERRLFDYAFQPIVDSATGRPVAYEALCRPTHERFSGPAALFEAAEHAGRVIELGRACRAVSALPLERLPEGCALFLNLHPRELSEALVMEEPLRRWVARLVFEITETAAIEDYERVREVIGALREHGCRIALDDLGAGYAGLNSLSQLQPDFVKLDMALVRRIHAKSSTRRLVKHILEFCSGEQIPVIAEGVETAEERAMVNEMGCPLMQGDFLARPGPAFPAVAP